MQFFLKWIFTGFLCFILSSEGIGQNLSNLKEAPKVGLSGGISANSVFSSKPGSVDGGGRLNYFLSGNLNLSLYGWQVPLSFSFANEQGSFYQPFNEYGLSPTYKWVKVHIGYRTMRFSPYTLQGQRFLGGGVELDIPESPFAFKVMYGRIRKGLQGVFRRTGYGVQLGYQKEQSAWTLNIFRGKDQLPPVTDSLSYGAEPPESNMVMSVTFEQSLGERFRFSGELAESVLNRDIRAPAEKTETFSLYNFTGPVFVKRSSSSVARACNFTLAYQADNKHISLNYKRVAPDFESHGTYRILNDIESASVDFSGGFFEQKLRVQTSLGTQRNNLDATGSQERKRLNGRVALIYRPSDKWNFRGSYSNFMVRTVIQKQMPLAYTDSLQLVNISRSSEVAVTKSFGAQKRSSLALNASTQRSASVRNHETANKNTAFNGNITYQCQFKEAGLSAGTGCYIIGNDEQETLSVGPSVNAAKAFNENKCRTSLSASYNALKQDPLFRALINARLNATLNLIERHGISIGCSSQWRVPSGVKTNTQWGYRATIAYNYAF